MKRKILSKVLTAILPLLLIPTLAVVVWVLIDGMTAGAVAISPAAGAADEPSCNLDGVCLDFGDFSPVSVMADTGTGVTYPSAPVYGALVYEDFKDVEDEARTKLRCGLDVREALSPYQEKTTFEDIVKAFDYVNGFGATASGLEDEACFPGATKLGEIIDGADQRLREARDLYAYLAVYAPEHRFRADDDYITETPAYSEPLCGATDKEDPDPAPDPPDGTTLDPVIDWCNFRARLRQSVREAANLRLIFGQQFMVDALGLHFSGNIVVGGEAAVRNEMAQLRMARYQFELAEQGVAEALGRAVGSGCYVSDFYRQPEWALLSRAVENQETAQHHIATRLSYMDIESEEQVGQARAAAQTTFRQASMEGHIKLIAMAGQAASGPLCAVGERPDGQLVADMALKLLETRRQSHEMADGRNVFGFDVTFTPARPFKVSNVTQCAQISEGDGLWEVACGAAEEARFKEVNVYDRERAFDESEQALLTEIEEIREGIDAQITAVSGCIHEGDDEEWYQCVYDEIAKLNGCADLVDEEPEDDDDGNQLLFEFDRCIEGVAPYPKILNGEAKQALRDLRSIFMQYLAIHTQAENIDARIQLSDDRNATVRGWLAAAGAAETVARVSQAALQMVTCMKPASGSDPAALVSAAEIDAFCWDLGMVNIAAQAVAGATSTAADVAIEDAEHHKEVRNLLLEQSELVIEAYAARQHFYSKQDAYTSLLDDLERDVAEAQRQRAYAVHSPANDPSHRIARDSSRLDLAQQMAKATRLAYLAARRAEYEYAARLAASNFRISDIYRARSAEDVENYLNDLARIAALLAGGASYQTNPSDFTISVAQHVLLLTDEALAKEGFTDPDAAQAERVRRFREWVAENTVPNDFEPPYDGKPVLRFNFTTSLLEGGLFSQVIQQAYDRFWLLKLSGVGDPKLTNNGLMANVLTEQDGLSYGWVALTQGGLVHMRSFAGCTFDYRLIAPAVLLGLEWAEGQDPEVATAVWKANVNGAHAYTENAFRVSEFLGRAASSTDWEVVVYAGAVDANNEPIDMDFQQLTDIELIFSTTYASREPGEPEPSECTRIDW